MFESYRFWNEFYSELGKSDIVDKWKTRNDVNLENIKKLSIDSIEIAG